MVIHKLRNTDGVGGWSAKASLLQSLVWYFINKMRPKNYYRWHTGWIRASEHKFAPTRVFMSSDYFLRGVKQCNGQDTGLSCREFGFSSPKHLQCTSNKIDLTDIL